MATVRCGYSCNQTLVKHNTTACYLNNTEPIANLLTQVDCQVATVRVHVDTLRVIKALEVGCHLCLLFLDIAKGLKVLDKVDSCNTVVISTQKRTGTR
jgi:hypothetical protein